MEKKKKSVEELKREVRFGNLTEEEKSGALKVLQKLEPDKKEKKIVVNFEKTMKLRLLMFVLVLNAIALLAATSFYNFEAPTIMMFGYYYLLGFCIWNQPFRKVFIAILGIEIIQLAVTSQVVSILHFSLISTLLIYVLFTLKELKVLKIWKT